MMQIKLVETESELRQIKELQRANLRTHLDAPTMASQGFVTVEYTMVELLAMHEAHPSVIAVNGGELAGFALILLPELGVTKSEHWPFLQQMAEQPYRGGLIKDYRYYIMGQVCVAEAYRGKGLFRQLYMAHRQYLSHRFDLMVTDVSTSNHRSLQAHLRLGFDIVHTYRDHIDEWHVVVWDWRRVPPEV